MAFGRRSAAHRGIPTTESFQQEEFRIFCQRQAARAEAMTRKIYRRYVDRCLKLTEEGTSAGDLRCHRRGYTYGGSTNHRGDIAESD